MHFLKINIIGGYNFQIIGYIIHLIALLGVEYNLAHFDTLFV